ncbi:MAG: hypothetical protein RML56_06855 [Burkholderiales bacterium]|nr:hypothetical protein [Burkholderiales bacterium]
MAARLTRLWAPAAACVAALLAPPAPAAECRVHDPELQGTYVGGCVGGLADGVGHAVGAAAEYRGEFKAGMKHGKGVKRWFASGDIYEGEFAEDRRHGFGVYTWGPRSPWAGERYRGGFVNDRRHGYGTYTWPWGDSYTGPWENDAIVGPPTPMMQARAKTRAALVAALRTPGLRVCREMPVGIAQREWIRGTVIESQGERIAVRIDDPGRHDHVLQNVPLEQGLIVWDAIEGWLPCR